MNKLFLLLCVVFPVFYAHAQTAELAAGGVGFFAAPVVETSFYSREGPAIGGGLILGIGDGVSGGFRMLYAKSFGEESIDTLEIAVFFRYYLFNSNIPIGLFFQIEAGTAIFAYNSAITFPSDAGSFVAGFAGGWRFPLGKHFYVEPAVRVGYPYIVGLGVSGGFRL